MTTRRAAHIGVFLCGFSALALPSTATAEASETLVPVQMEDTGASERVEAAALLRVLSQEAASAACHMANSIAAEESRALMTEAKGKFALLLDALQYGNPTMNIIGGEQRKKTVMKIETVRKQWAPIHEAAVTLLNTPDDKSALARIKADNEAVLASASVLTSEIASQYSNPAELIQADVLLVDFSGRQAMLTQKIAKIACEIWAGNRSDDRFELLTKSMETYDMTLRALLDGMPAVGLRAAPTEEIEDVLRKAREDWTSIEADLNIVLASADVSDDTKVHLYKGLNAAMYDMEKLEHMYVLFSKHAFKDDEDTGSEGALLD